ncbi:MAG: hypothetical protein M0031_07225 [Thermaerobacter sp.]|nr:hypothetical protein [Thermaerobacter sp.]
MGRRRHPRRGKSRRGGARGNALPPAAEWFPTNLVDEVRRLGRGIGLLASDEEMLEFDIGEDGRLGVEPVHDVRLPARILRAAARSEVSSLVVRTFLPETVAVRHGSDPDRVVRVPMKELRGWRIERRAVGHSPVRLEWTRITPEELRDAYSRDPETGEPVPLMVSERDHRFL